MNSSGPLILLDAVPRATPASSPVDSMILSPLRRLIFPLTFTFCDPWPSLFLAIFGYGIGTGPPGVGVLQKSIGPGVRHWPAESVRAASGIVHPKWTVLP